MVTLSNIAMEFGTQELYRDVNLFVGPNDRIGLVGHNGSGKSTILKMMAGLLEPSKGQVEIRKGTRIAYLPQTGLVVGHRTVLEEALAAWSHLDEIHHEMVECEHRMKDRHLPERELKAVLDRYAVLQQMHGQDAYDAESRAQKMLMSLGFKEEDFEKPLETQSGGYQVRAALARMLLEEPDLLLLDEPTNYLDIRSIEWLQDYLYRFKGAIVMIAHDRYLLDALVQRVWGIESGSVFIFPGNYSNYLSDRERRETQQLQQFEDQQAFIKRTEHFIAKFKGRKDTAPRAMSRQRMLDKLEIIEAPEVLPTIRIRFPEAEDVYGKAFEFRGVSRSFGDKHVLADVNLTIAGGEKVGLFGANGQGKTTMLRMLAGKLEPSEGSVWLSQKSQIAYYEQGAEESLDPNDTVLETVASAGSGFTTNELKGILGMFLFSGDTVEKRVRVLSGGERSRLAIIRVLLMPSNLLILDEPTNHLDIRSREILFEAMTRYQRTVVFSAHDRFMLDKLADKTVRVEGGQAVLFPGNFTYAAHQVVKVPAAPKPAIQPPKPRQETRPAVQKHKPQKKHPGHKPAGQAKPVVTVEQLRQRLERVNQQYEAARQGFQFDRAMALAAERREIEAEIEARKADELSEPGK